MFYVCQDSQNRQHAGLDRRRLPEHPTRVMTEKNDPTPPFDEAVSQLEELVESMESGELSLDELIRRFEHGAKLVHLCQRHLKDAELKIEKLKDDLQGFDLEPLDPDAPDSA